MNRSALLLAGLAGALALAALVVAVFALARPAAAPPGELAHHMAYLQRYAEKLHHAGAAQHWALASFYLHELEETGEAVAAGGYVEDGELLAPLVDELLMPAVHGAEDAVGARNPAAFAAAYERLVTACNTCHARTGHGFVNLQVPGGNGFPNQDFAPGPAR